MKMKEFATAYANRYGVTRAEAENVVHNVVNLITDSLKEGEDVQLTGYFTFQSKKRAAQTRKSPRTGETITVPERRVATVKIGAKVKAALNED